MSWKVNPWIVAVVGALLLLAGGAYYAQHLRAENEELLRERDRQKQRAVAAEDSLKKIRSYVRSSGASFTLYGRALHPTQQPDTLVESEGDVASRTDVELDPEPTDTAGTVRPDTSTTGLHTYYLDERIGRYDLSGRLEVYRPGDRIDYDITVDGQAFPVTFYRAKMEGVNRLRLGLPDRIEPAEVQGYYDTTSPLQQREERWDVHAPLAATRLGLAGNLGVGARVERGLRLPFGITATASVGLLVSPEAFRQTEGRLLSPEFEMYLEF
jgi:hypothetical protein